MCVAEKRRRAHIQYGSPLLLQCIELGRSEMRERRAIREKRGTTQIDRYRSVEVWRPVGQVCNHGFDKPVSVSKLERPVGGRFLADRGERRGRNLSPAQRSGAVCRVNFYLRRELQQLVEERMVEHCREFVRTNFPIAQIRSTNVTGKKCVSRK